MANTLGDKSANLAMECALNRRRSRCIVPIGGTGAVGTLDHDGDWTVTRTGAGTYNLTFPIVAANARAILQAGILLSATPTVFDSVVTAISLTAGTATVKFCAANGTVTDPASGDSVWFELSGTIGGAGP